MLELRWFFHGPIPPEVNTWFDLLGGDDRGAETREDLYFLVPGSETMGLKLRGGRLELKWRTATRPFESDSHIGAAETWEKTVWSYEKSGSDEVVARFQDPNLSGPRARVGKTRRQRAFPQTGAALESGVDTVLLELTELEVEEDVSWTLGFDVPGAVDAGLLALRDFMRTGCRDYPGPSLTGSTSFGYPRWLLNRAGLRAWEL